MTVEAMVTIPTWHCEEHDEHDPKCRKCTGRRDRVHRLAHTPEQFEDLALSIQQIVSSASVSYAELYEVAYGRPNIQDGGRSSRGDHSDPTRDAVVGSREIRSKLEDACDELTHAYHSAHAAEIALVRLGDKIDKHRPLRAEPAEQLRTSAAVLEDVLESHRAKVREIEAQLASEQRRIANAKKTKRRKR